MQKRTDIYKINLYNHKRNFEHNVIYIKSNHNVKNTTFTNAIKIKDV